MPFKPQCLPTAVGSFPHPQPGEALELIFSNLAEIPVWPQLPTLGFRENMYVQYSENLPRVVFDEARGGIHFDTSGDIHPSLERFLDRVVLEDVDAFGITARFAAGLHAFLERLATDKPEGLHFVKGQITGPISFGLTITDQEKRAILYHPELYEAIVKGNVMTARWQVRKLAAVHPNVIVFIDEPYLSAFGSAFINVPREQVIGNLSEVAEGIHREGAVAGVHCCGNTDWSILMETPIDIINFDAYSYFQGVTLYPYALAKFLDRGGVLAWGLVPVSEAVLDESVDSLRSRFEDGLSALSGKGIDRERLIERSLITPSCGMGGRSLEVAKRAMSLASGLSRSVREAYGLS